MRGKMTLYRGMFNTGKKHRLILFTYKLISVWLILVFCFSNTEQWLVDVFGFRLTFLPSVENVEASVFPAIKVESFDQDVTTDGSTFTLSNDVGATTSAFIKISGGTRKTSAGPTGSTANTSPDVGTVGLVLTDTNEVTVKRVNSTSVKVIGEVWRYEGAAGGSNEFIVRDRVTMSLTGASASMAISGITDVDKVIPFVTGYTVNAGTVNDWEDATIAAHMDDSGNLVVSRNNSGTAATVYVDVVEFTGSDWLVCHGYSASHDGVVETVTLDTDSDGQGGGTCDVSDWSTATIIEATMEGDSSETGLSDTLALVRPGANTTSVVFDLLQDSGAFNDGAAWIHVLQNDDLVVNRASDADIAEGNGTYGTASWPSGASTSADLDSLSLEWFTDTSGVGTAHMRGGLHARITDPTGTIEHWVHRSGNTVGVEYGVVELSGLTYVDTTTVVSAVGTQNASVDIPSVDTELGGVFIIAENVTPRNVTSITLTESGSIDASIGLNNIEIWYDLDSASDCSGVAYDGDETQFGATDTNGFSGPNGVTNFSDSVGISTSQTFCAYIVYDVTEAASDGDTVQISIENPSTDVSVTLGGIVGPNTNVGLTGSTTVRNAELTQTHYRWLNDDGVEGSATAIENEDTAATGFANGTIRRLRMQVDTRGSTSSVPTAYRLEYAQNPGSCSAATGWTDVGAGGGDWDMSDSIYFVVDGLDSTNIGTGSGGVSDPAVGSFLGTNGGLRDTSSETGALTLTSSQFVEFEFAIEPTVGAPQGNTYCFRLTDQGTALRNYDVYAQGTISADITVSVSGSATASFAVGTTSAYTGGVFIIERAGGNRTVTDITISESGTIDAQTNVDNIELWYDMDSASDCSGVAYDGDETQFGTTDTDGFSGPDGTATFSGTQTVNNSNTMCVYVVLDVTTGATDGQSLKIQITDPSTEVIVTSSSVGPSSILSPSASTTINGPVITQTGYHWRNDDGSETSATSASGGVESTPISAVPKESPRRLRLQVDNEGTVTSATTQYRLEYGTKVTTCANVGTWNDVGPTGGAFDLVDSTNLTDGSNTTDVSGFANGEITNPGGSIFQGTNGGQKDTSSETGGITLNSGQFVELEYSIEATTEAGDNTTYCFRLTDAGTPISGYTNYAELITREKLDFYIQRGTATTTGNSITLTAGVDYIAPSSSSSAFVRITNSQITGAGRDTSGTTQAADDVTAFISNPSNIETNFTITRPTGASNNTVVDWEIIEFIGVAATDNEMIVRSQGAVTYGTSALYATGTAVSGVADDSDVVVFITGQQNPDTSTGYYTMLSTASWDATTQQPVFQRGDSGSDAAQISYAVVEFTGVNWNIQRIEHTYGTSASAETESITPVTSPNQAFVHVQKRNGAGETGLDDFGQEVWLSSSGAVSFQLQSSVTNFALHTSVAWVIENTQTGDGAMVVSRSNGTLGTGTSNGCGGTQPCAEFLSIGSPLNNINNGSLFITNRGAGTGTAFPRTVVAARIVSTSQYRTWRSETGQAQTYRTAVVQWPVAEISYRQNYYRFYVDNDALTPSDPWPVGATDLGENTSITGADDPLGEGERVRIRMSVLVNNASLPASTKSFKLQYGRRDTSCSAISAWSDVGAPGGGEIWRGYNATPADGTEVASTSLLISVSDRAGTYEESNPSAVNPWSADIGQDIEYDWVVEQNGAVQRSDYCFRMVNSDDSPLTSYNQYPTLRTTGYTPVIGDWRWYGDENNETPLSALAGENVSPSDVINEDAIKLRVMAHEVEGASGSNVKFRLQYSERADFSDGGYFVTATSSCTATSTWCYVDAAGNDNQIISTSTLTNTDACVLGVGSGCGNHNEQATTTTTLTQTAGSKMEFEFAIKPAGPRVNTVYFFRLYDVPNDEALVASSSYPSLVTEGGSLSFTVEGVGSGQSTEGVTTDVATTPISIPFGELPFDTDYNAAYRLTVDVNATEGYQMFMYANQDMLDSYGNKIEPISGTNDTPVSWSTGCPGSAVSCIGYHVGDDALSGGSTRFSPNDSYAAMSTSTPEEVMFSSQPSTNESSDLIFRIRVSDQQPAGVYQNDVTFISVPTF